MRHSAFRQWVEIRRLARVRWTETASRNHVRIYGTNLWHMWPKCNAIHPANEQADGMKIREFLTEANWGQGRGVAFDGKDCLVTAIGRCYESDQDNTAIIDKIRDAIDCYSIVEWNDAPERTFAEVKALLEKLDI